MYTLVSSSMKVSELCTFVLFGNDGSVFLCTVLTKRLRCSRGDDIKLIWVPTHSDSSYLFIHLKLSLNYILSIYLSIYYLSRRPLLIPILVLLLLLLSLVSESIKWKRESPRQNWFTVRKRITWKYWDTLTMIIVEHKMSLF